MSAERPPVYIVPSRGVVAGAVFLRVPVVYAPPSLMPATVLANKLLQVEEDFDRAWQRASPRIRDVGVPVLALAKPRPVVVLKVGAAEEDAWHREHVWVAPRYTHKEHRAPRHGRNIFDLPAASEFGLDEDGFLDFLQVATLPVTLLKRHDHRCDLNSPAFDALLAAFAAFLLP